MKHLKDYFDNFEACKLESLFDELYQDDWKVSGENLVDSFGVEWNFGDINCFISISRNTFIIIVESYKIFLEFQDTINNLITKDTESIQEKLESANSKIRLLEEQNNDLKKELDLRRKELYVPIESPKSPTKEYISLRRRKYVKIE
jgi:hypothetical protein